jgi:hypothetical protein
MEAGQKRNAAQHSVYSRAIKMLEFAGSAKPAGSRASNRMLTAHFPQRNNILGITGCFLNKMLFFAEKQRKIVCLL